MSAHPPTTEERLTDLEIRYAHQSRLVAALDDVVREFAARVERLERQLAALRESQAAEAAPGAAPGSDERPPHY